MVSLKRERDEEIRSSPCGDADDDARVQTEEDEEVLPVNKMRRRVSIFPGSEAYNEAITAGFEIGFDLSDFADPNADNESCSESEESSELNADHTPPIHSDYFFQRFFLYCNFYQKKMSFDNGDGIYMSVVAKEATATLPVSCGVATFNKRTKQLSVFEFVDSCLFPTLESILLQIQPEKAVLCSHNSKSLSKEITSVVNATCPALILEIISTAPSVDDALIESDLQRLLVDSATSSYKREEWMKSDLAKKAFLVLLKEFRILSNTTVFNSCRLCLESPTSGIFVKLDRATFNALNLFPPSQNQSNQIMSANSSSLFGLLNKCKTRMGSRRLQQWIRQPLVSVEKIRQRHEAVEALLSSARTRQLVHGARLNRVPDLDVIGSKLATEQSSSVSLEDLVRVYEAVVAINCLVDDLKGLKSENLNSLVVVLLEQSVRNMEGFMRLVESTLDLEAASKNDFRIDSKFDPSLATISQKRESVLKEIEKLRSHIEKSIDSVKIVECLAPYAMAFRVSRKQMAAVQSLGSKYKQVQINKAEYLFTSSALMERVEELQSVECEYQKKASAVVKKIVSVASSYHAVVSSLADTVGILDVLTSFAVAASMCKLTRPLTDIIAPLNLKRCRHLLVEIRSLELTGTDYIPNDVFMTRESNCQIITGPNMGGKSTYIRSVALAVLMNQIGCFVPCDPGSSLPTFDSIMCRVGASDAQVRGVSTFMQEMIEAATIVNSATSRSLVIVDELGRGTSTQDGFGLAWAIAKHLKDVSNSFVFFATHFHELSQLPGAANRHVAAAVNENGLTLLYEVRDGPTSNSFGPNVAALAGYPAQVVQDAITREKTLVLEASYRVNLDAARE